MASPWCLLVSAVCLAGSPNNPLLINGWSSTWEFIESWQGLSGQTELIVYKIRLKSLGGQLQSEIDIDGHQMLCRVLASVQVTKDRLKFRFLRNREEHVLPEFKPGELLFELHQKSGKILTRWGSLEPTIEEHRPSGQYFKPQK